MAYAHSRNDRGERQGLVDHLRGVAERTADFAEPLGAREAGYYLGLWHDVGKFDPAWQRYLLDAEAGRVAPGSGPDHKAAGTGLARVLGPAALVIQGHHGGLRAGGELRGWLAERGSRPAVAEAIRLARAALPDLESAARIGLPTHLEGRTNDAASAKRAAELFIRLLFSALVDADSLDTEAHASAERAALRGTAVTMAELWARLDRYLSTLRAGAGTGSAAVRGSREAIQKACLEAAETSPGLFRLAAPTGGGKTLSGLAFALRHALIHGKRRVIVAVPFITITEQTVDVYRRVLERERDTPVVLEHHSGSRELVGAVEESENGAFSPDAIWPRLAAENWDAPIVVTTTVQLFESLFGRTRTACRKLHRLTDSVVILDEVQALPAHLLDPILDVLRELCAHYRTTVLLSTATQPAFETIPVLKNLPATDVLGDPAPLFRALKRVRYEWRLDPPLGWTELADLVQTEEQALVVVNTKADALSILDALGDPDALHLSTLLCGAHRRAVLAEVRRRLAADEPCRLVATQVVEAGVDVDFPLVLRAMGPLDGIIQAAGRCNREGRLAAGRVIVFQPAEGGIPPGTYERGREVALALRQAAALDGSDLDPNDPSVYGAYSRQLLSLEATDARDIQALRTSFDYPEVARKFRMIDDDTLSLVVTTYGTDVKQREVEALLAGLREPRRAAMSPRQALRRLQPYLVTVRRREAERYRRAGLLTDVRPAGRPEVSYGLAEWHGDYDPIRGLTPRGPGAERFVV
ncbi:MAG: CRISPR-associated endonuclease Cas3'' [Chloroflexi bacterium]|nr:CRISPR-associated endonuclease Cas3'' [Chloroflexota bacterium]